MLEIFVNNQLVDTTQDVKIAVDKIVSEYRNPSKLTGSYSYDFTLPLTSNNNRIFNNIIDAQTVGKFTQHVYDMSVYVDGIMILEGIFNIKDASRYPAVITGFVTGVNGSRLGDIIPDKTLREITSYADFTFEGEETIVSTIAAVQSYSDTTQVAFTYVPESFRDLLQGKPQFRFTDFGLSHFVVGIVKNIFTDLDYEVQGDILSADAFKKAMLLYSNESGENPKYNYGHLNPFTSYIPIQGLFNTVAIANEVNRVERDTDYVYCIQPGFTVSTGDNAGCLLNGVYTCKYSGLYNFSMNATIESSVPLQYFVTFRRISGDNEFLAEGQLPGTSNFNTAGATGYNSDLDTFKIGNGTFSAKLKEGEQYAVQMYVSVAKSYNPSGYILYHNTQNIGLNLVGCEGKQVINPADFLPAIKQKDFLLGIFKIFNLYYTIDNDAKQVHLFTRNEFFEQNSTNVLSLDSYCDIQRFKQIPISKAETDAMFFKYMEDKNDFIQSKTDYLTAIGNALYKDSEELPFSPLSYFKLPIKDATGVVQAYIPIPAVITDTTTLDQSELADDKSNSFSYSPKIVFYHGNQILKESVKADSMGFLGGSINPVLMFTFATGGYVGVQPFGQYVLPGADSYTFFPTLSFINPEKQDAYAITINTVRQEFTITKTIDTTIFEDNNQTYLRDATVLEDTRFSLGFTGDYSLFQQNYQSDLRIANYSNYIEGTIKINSSLYNQLTGRNILQLNNGLYLLERIRGYQLGTPTAIIRIYQNM